jgi:glutathione S-transferase
MTITITAFERSPDGGRGLARDTRVRWALEEVGQPYQVRLVSFRAMKEPAHLALHPFGQIPTYEEGDLALFETGSIVFHIAQRHAGLLPGDADARTRAITWMFAALNTVEPPILERETARLLEGERLGVVHRSVLDADDMLELGRESQRFHEELDPLVRGAGVYLMITVGTFAHLAAKGVAGTVNYPDAQAASAAIASLPKPGDLVAVKASRRMGLDKVVAAIQAKGDSSPAAPWKIEDEI